MVRGPFASQRWTNVVSRHWFRPGLLGPLSALRRLSAPDPKRTFPLNGLKRQRLTQGVSKEAIDDTTPSDAMAIQQL